MSGLRILKAGPGITVQDLGREGHLASGLSRGGAADRLALAEGAALLGQDVRLAAVEIPGTGLEAEAEADIWIALTGAPLRARIGEQPLAWNASHLLRAGERLSLGAAERGLFGCLHLAGGVAAPEILGARSAHLTAGLGAALSAGDQIPAGKDAAPGAADRLPMTLPLDDRFAGGEVRVVAGPQTALFPPETLSRFEATSFARSPRGNRQGVALSHEGESLALPGRLTILSEAISPGDIQITGDGPPYVLGPECQTTGGYPRIATVIPQDLPRVMQAPPGAPLRFRFVDLAEARRDWRAPQALAEALRRARRPLVRDPHQMRDLLSHQLVGGVTAGRELSEAEEAP